MCSHPSLLSQSVSKLYEMTSHCIHKALQALHHACQWVPSVDVQEINIVQIAEGKTSWKPECVTYGCAGG